MKLIFIIRLMKNWIELRKAVYNSHQGKNIKVLCVTLGKKAIQINTLSKLICAMLKHICIPFLIFLFSS